MTAGTAARMEPSVPEDAIDARPNAFTRELAAGMRTHSMWRVPELEGSARRIYEKSSWQLFTKDEQKTYSSNYDYILFL